MITTWLIIGFFVLLLIIFIRIDLGDTAVFMLILIIVTAIIGFLVIPNTANYQTEIVKLRASEILKSSTTVYVEFENFDNKSYSEKKIYDKIDSTTIFYLYREFDKSGDLNREYIKIELSDKKDTIYFNGMIENID